MPSLLERHHKRSPFRHTISMTPLSYVAIIDTRMRMELIRHQLLAERKRFALQLERTVIIMFAGVFIVVLLMFALVTPLPRPEPLVDLPTSVHSMKEPGGVSNSDQ